MKQVTINVPENQYAFFLELLKNLGLEKAEEEAREAEEEALTEEELLEDLAQAFREVKLIEEGKMKSRPAKEFLDEL